MPDSGAPIQGLRVSLKFADSQNPVEILRNLNLNIEDLDVIRGITDSGVEQADIRSLSGLTFDLEKEAVAINAEVGTYENVLSSLNDGRRRIGGNIDISGSIVAPTFKFRTVDFEDGNQIRTVDFSTSRASAWSAFGDASESVFYGGDVILSGNTSIVELSSLEFANNPVPKRFESQVPTHKIRVSIDGEDYDLYAMKGIPIRFTGFFRSVRNLRVDFNILSELRPSWIVRNISTDQEFIFENRISGSGSVRQSIISFFDSRAQEREIEFYYPVDRMTRLDLNDIRLFKIPEVSLPNLTSFSATNSDLLEMPDISFLYPNLATLNLSGSDLTRSDTPELRTFSPEVIQRLKTPNDTLRTLVLNNVYSNECTADLSELVGLTSFSASTGTRNRRMSGTSPEIGPELISYVINGNSFSQLANTVFESTTLQTLNIRSNGLGGIIDTSGDNLKSIVSFTTGDGNNHAIVDMSGKEDLRTYTSSEQTFQANNIGTDVFNGCESLEDIFIQNTNVTGNLPNFTSNGALRRVFSWNTRWGDATVNHSIDENTFGPTGGGCRPTLNYFNLQSFNLRGSIHPLAFRGMTSLETLVVRSYNRGITGGYPESLNECFNLRTLYLFQNQMSGPLPNFAGNRRLVTLILSENNFEGIVPSLNLPSLRTLFVQRNNLTGFQSLNCENLVQINASFNNLNIIPSFTNAFRVQTIILNNNSGMRYSSGELEFVTAIRRVEMTNCGFNQGTVDQILVDLNENYNRNPRRNVLINLTGNSPPSATEEIATIINRLRREGWTLGLET
jgi:Leucine-rich repeat (LRR) protein